MPETKELINNMVNEFSFTKVSSPDLSPVPSPKEKMLSYNTLVSPVSEHLVSHLQSTVVLENDLFLGNIEKKSKSCKR